jgi:hypothetical protein
MPEIKHIHIRIIAGALDDCEGNTVLRGVVCAESLERLKVADYQREVLPDAKIVDLADVMIANERLPDIELGMRGDAFEILEDDSILLKDAVYIIDGLQRVSAGRMLVNNSLATPRLGCLIHFSTTEQWERERFRKLNLLRTKLSASVILRNMREENGAVGALWHLSEEERTSPIYGRVCWQQRMSGSQLITAVQLLKTTGRINARFGPGRTVRAEDLAKALEKTMGNMGEKAFVGNVRRFYNTIDECFSLRRRTMRSGITCLRDTFLQAFAWVLSSHQDFWQGNELVVPRSFITKIKLYKINDPEVVRLAGSGGQAWVTLATGMVEHFNSGKRPENRLKRFSDTAPPDGEAEDDDVDEALIASA